jgi:hypothetical protein
MTDEATTPDPQSPTWFKSIPTVLVLGTALLSYEALRLAAVTDLNTNSALTIITDGGSATMLLGTFVTLLPTGIAALFAVCSYWLSNSRNRPGNIGLPAIATIVSLLLVVTVAPWYIAAIQAPSFAYIWLRHLRTHRLLRKGRSDLNRFRRELDEMAEIQDESEIILAMMRAELKSAEATYESHRIDIYHLPLKEPNDAALLLEVEELNASELVGGSRYRSTQVGRQLHRSSS